MSMASSMSGQDELIGYPSGQDGAILPARYYPLYRARKISPKANNKSFIDQACSIKVAGY